MKPPLISPRPVGEFTPDEYHSYVTEMFQLRTKGSTKPRSPVPGVSISRLKSGKLSLRRTAKTRAFAYVLRSEIIALAKHMKLPQSDVWNVFVRAKWIIAASRLEAEQIYATQEGIPW